MKYFLLIGFIILDGIPIAFSGVSIGWHAVPANTPLENAIAMPTSAPLVNITNGTLTSLNEMSLTLLMVLVNMLIILILLMIVVKLCSYRCNQIVLPVRPRPDYNNGNMLPMSECTVNSATRPTYNINVAPANKYYNFY